MKRFNLIDERWIPVRFIDGNRSELGIRETFLRLEEIALIEDGSPLVVASLYRFLLAVLYRALESFVDDSIQIKVFFKSGLPLEKVVTYLEKWHDRFWLFHEQYPFYQIPDFVPKEWRSWTTLSAEYNDQNSKVLFDHVDVQSPEPISEAFCARLLVATQTFSLGKGKSEFAYTSGAPSSSGVMVIPLGRNLEDTLLFLLVPQNRFVSEQDKPIWEREPDSIEYLKNGPERGVVGYADLYTWRARSILLKSDLQGVSSIAFASGVKPLPSFDKYDPMLVYETHKEFGIIPRKFREKGLWRNYDSLLPGGPTDLVPKVIENSIRFAGSDLSRIPSSVLVVGQANDQAKINFWRMERFALPETLAEDGNVRSHVQRLLEISEIAQKYLWLAANEFARNILARNGARKIKERDTKKFVQQMSCIPLYWSKLEILFFGILQMFTLGVDQDLIELEWRQAVCRTLDEAWEKHRNSVSTRDVWTMWALVKADGKIRPALSRMKEEIAAWKQRLEKEVV